MISACKDSVSRAYSHIGDADEESAKSIVRRLSSCAIRDACPYARECARTVGTLRRDIAASESTLAVVSSNSYLLGSDGLI